jgi:hypothetical protein
MLLPARERFGRSSDLSNSFIYVASTDLLWKNSAPLKYTSSPNKRLETCEQILHMVSQLHSVISHHYTYAVFKDIT